MRELLNDLQAAGEKLVLEGNTIRQVTYELLEKDSREELTAIDGGSATILHTTSNCVLFVRVIAVTMGGRKTIKKNEGYVLASTNGEQTTVSYYPLAGPKQLLFTTEDALVSAANLGRKILEWRTIDEQEGVVVWDGSLTPINNVEETYLPRNPRLIGVSKTTGTLGNWKIFSESPQEPWKAHAFGKVWFAKLHENARHYFRIDARTNIDILIPWSCDPSFLGYPYPLILADQLARVSNEEAGIQKIRLQTMAGDQWESFSSGGATKDAHEILDSLQY